MSAYFIDVGVYSSWIELDHVENDTASQCAWIYHRNLDF